MRHLLVTFVNQDPYSACITNSYDSTYDAERAARAYLEDHPTDSAHVYSWALGFSGMRVVRIETEYNPPEMPPAVEPLEPPIASEITALCGDSDESAISLETVNSATA